MLDSCLTTEGFVKGKDGVVDGNPGCYFGSYSVLKKLKKEIITNVYKNILNLKQESSNDEWTGIMAACILSNTNLNRKCPLRHYLLGGVSILYKLSQNIVPNTLDWLWFIPIILQNIIRFDGTSGTILNFIKINTIMLSTDYPWYMPFKYWKKKVLQKYPNGMQDVYTIYFNKEHPLAIESKGIV